jgi:uncharacterized protein (TIGR02246 family)
LKEFLKGSRLDTEITQLRFLTPDVALIHAKGAVVKGHGGGIDAIPGCTPTIAVRTDGRWLLAGSQNTTHRWFVEKLMGEFDSRTLPSPIAGQ